MVGEAARVINLLQAEVEELQAEVEKLELDRDHFAAQYRVQVEVLAKVTEERDRLRGALEAVPHSERHYGDCPGCIAEEALKGWCRPCFRRPTID